jgi:hypothetical protein
MDAGSRPSVLGRLAIVSALGVLAAVLVACGSSTRCSGADDCAAGANDGFVTVHVRTPDGVRPAVTIRLTRVSGKSSPGGSGHVVGSTRKGHDGRFAVTPGTYEISARLTHPKHGTAPKGSCHAAGDVRVAEHKVTRVTVVCAKVN